MAFVPLFCQTHFSPRGVASAADLARRARALGYTTLGLCDESTIAGFHAFDAACKAQGIRPVFGCRLQMTGLGAPTRCFPIDFLIETEQGYRNLVRLLTIHHARGEEERRLLGEDDLRGRTGGLTAVVPFDGELRALVEGRDRAVTERFLEAASRLFAGGLAFGLESPEPKTAPVARMIVGLARFVHATVLAAPLIRYPEPGDEPASVFLNNPGQAPGRAWQPPAQVKLLPALWPEADVLGRWTGEWEELPHVAGDLARRAAWRPGRIRRVFPSLDLERGFDANSYLFDLVIQGATERYGEITEPIKQRINREFEEARAQNMAPYLLLCHQIARALEDRGISRGVGRGRLVASVLAYSLGISRIDPLQYNLVAKSLLGDNETVPPVLVEIPRGGVEPLLEWLRESFGEGRLAEIGRVQEARRDQMINELAEWAGMTDEERRLAHREKARLRSAGAAQRLGELAAGKRSRRWRDASFVGDLAARLAPRPRSWQGTGDRYVLCGEPLDAIVPMIRSSQDRPVTMLEDAAIDRLGLARLAFVPHGLLDILDQAMQAARAQRPGLDFSNVPLEDRATYELLARGDTAGIPPLEGIAMRSLLRRQAPRNLLQLLRVKTEAGVGREGAPARDLAFELPDVLLSYQCAYIKANFPLAFYGAAISAVVGARGNPVALAREARHAGYEIKPPDINLSDWDTTIQAGAIRLGLATVKGFGRRAWEHVKNVRSGGSFESLEAFCERIDTRLINLRTLRMLIAAGAMDRLARNRATMDAVIAQLQKNARELEEIQGGAGQVTLFDMDSGEEGDAPSLAPFRMPDIEEWNDWDKVQREREALGFYLSMDPVRRFRIVLGHLRPLHMEEVSPRLAGRFVRLAGLITAVEREGPLVEGDQWVVADMEGLPVYLTPHMAEVSADCLEPATEALVIGRMERDGVGVRMIADGIWRLADLEDQATRVARLRLRLAGENRATLKLLLTLAREFPGAAELDLVDYPGRHGWTWGRLARQRVFFCSPLYQRLCRILPPDAIELFGQAGEPLAVQWPGADKRPAPPADTEDPTPQAESPETGDGAEMTEVPDADEPTQETGAPSEAETAGETNEAKPTVAAHASGAPPHPSAPPFAEAAQADAPSAMRDADNATGDQ